MIRAYWQAMHQLFLSLRQIQFARGTSVSCLQCLQKAPRSSLLSRLAVLCRLAASVVPTKDLSLSIWLQVVSSFKGSTWVSRWTSRTPKKKIIYYLEGRRALCPNLQSSSVERLPKDSRVVGCRASLADYFCRVQKVIRLALLSSAWPQKAMIAVLPANRNYAFI